VIEWEFTPDDVARVRFALSPLWELVHSLIVLRDPGSHALHLPWVRAIRPLIAGLELSELFALVPVHGDTADFLGPPPASPLPDFAEELAAVRATPPDRVAAELAGLPRLPERVAERIRTDPQAAISRLADTLQAYRDIALAGTGRGSRRCWKPTCCGGPGRWLPAVRRPCSRTCTRPSPGAAAG